ncbi:TIGR02449 family protein [Pontibacterium sp. N1Y112]|uniref:TIGR02449 family protein n=1 Tax=Pontibacterium sinense TaxID=2781979 RepID=A0A8J7FTB0_9GAMM|nr:TIGR02449 family protein [Pontibacterium sinense]MBE9396900.1 TIGR02449 family protein [Pontibacterium sinense]MCO4758099.1 TIGR02449 family protein [Oceanospirillaceae bacterium]
MSEQHLTILEQKVDQLLAYCDQLEQDNKRLRQQEHELKQERLQMIQLNDQTRHKVEAMIQRLKALEQSA